MLIYCLKNIEWEHYLMEVIMMGKMKKNPSPQGIGAASVQGKKTRGFTAEYESGYQGQGNSSNNQYKK
jgi:hypothetical protein